MGRWCLRESEGPAVAEVVVLGCCSRNSEGLRLAHVARVESLEA